MPLQFASPYDGQGVFVWSDCLLDPGTDFLVGKRYVLSCLYSFLNLHLQSIILKLKKSIFASAGPYHREAGGNQTSRKSGGKGGCTSHYIVTTRMILHSDGQCCKPQASLLLH